MLETLSRYWWVVALRGLFAVAFGAVALLKPDATLSVLVALFGAYAIFDGLFALAGALAGGRAENDRRRTLLVEGIVGVVTGIVTFVWPNVTVFVLLWLIGFRAVVTGGLQIATAVRLRRELKNEWLLVLSGLISIAFGIYVAAFPQQSAIVVMLLIGIYAIAFGITLIGLAVRLRQHRHHLATAADHGQAVPA